jgi:uncharacterized protein (DUF427 family)
MPLQGTARYFSLKRGDKRLVDAVWSYEHPYDEQADLKERLAFFNDKAPGIRIQLHA